MTENTIINQCTNPTQSMIIEIPCVLAERIDRYAKDNVMTVTGVMIEALDKFLRNTD